METDTPGEARLSPERIAAIELSIEQIGLKWRNEDVYKRVGGKYYVLIQYLKILRQLYGHVRQRGHPAISPSQVVEQMAQEAPGSLDEELHAVTEAMQYAEMRLHTLEEKSLREMLSEDELSELLRLERRTRTMSANIERLEREVAAQRTTRGLDEFQDAWPALAQAKREAYQAFADVLPVLFERLQAVLQCHADQEGAIDQLEDAALAQWLHTTFLPDGNTIRARLAGNMTPAQPWTSILCESYGPQTLPDGAHLSQNDPGCAPLSGNLIRNALAATSGVRSQ